MICYNNIKKERKSNLKGVIRTTQHNRKVEHIMDNFKLLSIIAVRKTAINKEMYAQIKANSRTETQYDIVERINAVLEASRDVSEGYGAKKGRRHSLQ